jgi:preprotein translocase subunit SecG
MIFGILLFLFLVVCVLLCLLVLIQSDKGGGISGAIGGGLSGASNFLGTQDTANVLTKGTYIFGSVFLLLCVLMTFFVPGGRISKSEMQKRAEQAQAITATPATPVAGFGDEAESGAGGAMPFGIESLIEEAGGIEALTGEETPAQ